ncbi:MAG: hypothetical protein ACLR6B_16165 [Blautia sp.]
MIFLMRNYRIIGAEIFFAAVPMFTIGFNMPKINIKWLTDRTIMVFSLLSVCLLFAESMAFHANPSIQGANNYIF